VRQQMPTVEELLVIDLLRLREHTERTGDQIELATHISILRESLGLSRTCSVRLTAFSNGPIKTHAFF
jgi:hypothetical protein